MKLYATTTSERASKGQGGKHLDIQLQGENRQELGVIALRYEATKQEYYALYIRNGIIQSIFHIEKETKGKRQKGECEHQFIPSDNEGCYGYEVCRLCGKKQHN